MSTTRVWAVDKKGELVCWREFTGDQLISTTIWAQLISRNRKARGLSGSDTAIVSEKELIRLIESGELQLEQRELAVLATTLSRAMIKRAHFSQLADLIEQYVAQYAASNQQLPLSMLRAQAGALREMFQQRDIIAACWQHGIAQSCWQTARAVDQGYNIFKDLDHWFIFTDGFIPPRSAKRAPRLIKIAIAFESEKEWSNDELNKLAEQYRALTGQLVDHQTAINIEVARSQKKMSLIEIS